MIFVFGSNKAGRHGAGAALYALKNHGAVYGEGFGLWGNSFAIPTKGYNIEPLTFEEVTSNVSQFLHYADVNPGVAFALTPVGCGLAGHNKRDMWAFLKSVGVPSNVYLTSSWVNY